jgi:septum site-determining protein MinD
MTHTLLCCGAKGGIGKTTTTINLAAALNNFGRDVTVVDGDVFTPNLGLHLGVPSVPISLHDVLKGKNHITEAVYEHPSGFKIVPASISLNEIKNLKSENLSKTLPGLYGLTEIILIDAPPGLGREAFSSFNAVKDVLVITNPELPAITDALKTIKIAESLGKRVIGVVLTKTGKELDVSIKNIETLLENKVVAVIPEDDSVREALVKKDSVVYTNPKSKAAIAYKKLAASLIGINYKEEIEEGFFKKFFKSLGL